MERRRQCGVGNGFTCAMAREQNESCILTKISTSGNPVKLNIDRLLGSVKHIEQRGLCDLEQISQVLATWNPWTIYDAVVRAEYDHSSDLPLGIRTFDPFFESMDML